jgi:hypothetical protein
MPARNSSSHVRSEGAAELSRIEHILPFWGPQLVILIAIAIDVTLPDRLVPLRPTWLLPGLEALLLVGLVGASPQPRWRHSPARRRFALGLIALVSAANIVSLILLVHYLLQSTALQSTHTPTSASTGNQGHQLILAGSGLWITNVLLFGVWYWELDRGGPLARRLHGADRPDFLFPQMTDTRYAPEGWLPGLVDYLYVSFTNATAFSPTDTMPLTPMAKWLMAAQSLASLVTVGLVVARAVNILG